MKTLSIRQPWAWAIMAGLKRVENRDWSTKYRGTLLIHAGLRLDRAPRTHALFAQLEIVVPDNLPRGVILGSVELVDVLPVDSLAEDPWAFGELCWILKNPQSFARSVPQKGRLGLFDVAVDLLSPVVT